MSEFVKKYPNKITLQVTDRELEILEFIQKHEGQSALPGVIHDCIKEYYNKTYVTKYKQNKMVEPSPYDGMTAEEICVKKGGKVNPNGTCTLPEGTMMATISMSDVEAHDTLPEYQ